MVYKSFIKDKAWQLLTMASRAQQHLIILNLIVSPRDTDLCAEIENVNHISFEDICSADETTNLSIKSIYSLNPELEPIFNDQPQPDHGENGTPFLRIKSLYSLTGRSSLTETEQLNIMTQEIQPPDIDERNIVLGEVLKEM